RRVPSLLIRQIRRIETLLGSLQLSGSVCLRTRPANQHTNRPSTSERAKRTPSAAVTVAWGVRPAAAQERSAVSIAARANTATTATSRAERATARAVVTAVPGLLTAGERDTRGTSFTGWTSTALGRARDDNAGAGARGL